MNEVENSIHRGIREMAPDLFQQIAADESPKLTREVWLDGMEEAQKTCSGNFWVRAYRTATVLAACCLLLMGWNLYGLLKVDSIVELDVNPSLELQLNKAARVVRVKALNADGVKILDNMESSLNREHLGTAVEMLVDSMIEEGYISRDKDSVLISVDNKDAAKSAELEQAVVDDFKRILEEDQIEGTLYHQSLNGVDKTAEESAKKYGISKGKAVFIREIRQKDDSLSEGELAVMSMQEITDWLQEQNIHLNEELSMRESSSETGLADGDLMVPETEEITQEEAEEAQELTAEEGETMLSGEEAAQCREVAEEAWEKKEHGIPNIEIDDLFTNQIPTNPKAEEEIKDFSSDKDPAGGTEIVPDDCQENPPDTEDQKPEITNPSDQTPGYQLPGGDGSTGGQPELPDTPETPTEPDNPEDPEIPEQPDWTQIPELSEGDFEGLPVIYQTPLKILSVDTYHYLLRMKAEQVPPDEAECQQMFEELFSAGNTIEGRISSLDAQLRELHGNGFLEDWQYVKALNILERVSQMKEEAFQLLERKFPDNMEASLKASMAEDGCQ